MFSFSKKIKNIVLLASLFGVLVVSSYLMNSSRKLVVCSVFFVLTLWLLWGIERISGMHLASVFLLCSGGLNIVFLGYKSIYVASYFALFASSMFFLLCLRGREKEISIVQYMVVGVVAVLVDAVCMGGFYVGRFSLDFCVSASCRSVVCKSSIYMVYLLPMVVYRYFVQSGGRIELGEVLDCELEG